MISFSIDFFLLLLFTIRLLLQYLILSGMKEMSEFQILEKSFRIPMNFEQREQTKNIYTALVAPTRIPHKNMITFFASQETIFFEFLFKN